MRIAPIKLESDRLLIRNYSIKDAPALFELVKNNIDLLKDYFPMSVEQNTSIPNSRKYILQRHSDRKKEKSLFAGIFTPEGRLIGQICAKDINWRVPKCEAGYFLDKNFHGKGLAKEAIELFTEHCFRKLGIIKITLRIEPQNTISKILAEKSGFKMIGLAKNDFRSSTGRLMDCELWEKVIQ
jgi:RimJ/RimL family protein N-acetyltransferase